MNFDDVMKYLMKVGTAQNVKVYRRHGAGDNLFGVSFAELRKLAKKIKKDQALAEQLWKTGNTDAQSLAILIADPHGMTMKTAESWVKGIGYYLLADLLGGLVATTPFAVKCMKKWTANRKEFVRQTGYVALATMLKDNHPELSDDDCRSFLKTIENEIHGSANRARHSMNSAVMAIGIYRPGLTKEALATAKRIGPVEVDHGETSCKTHDAAAYIEKALSRKR